MGKIPDISWKRLSKEEAIQRVNSEHDDPTGFNDAMMKLIQRDLVTVWLDEKGKLHYQYKPECLRGII